MIFFRINTSGSLISIAVPLVTDGMKRYKIQGFMCKQRKDIMCLYVCYSCKYIHM